jgi:pimeloyl-[acyl-carrier protein] methyl ester esterase
MTLHVEVSGHGQPLVMLHGWGMHGGIWADTAARLAQDFAVSSVDLPGHGFSGKGCGGREKGEGSLSSSHSSPFTLDSIVSELSAQFPGPVNLLGWSLGGIIAQHWAVREPQKIARLVLVASTPCFTERADWQFGMPRATLEQFAAELGHSHAATLRRFLALQVRGSEGERELLGSLREQLFSRGEPEMGALRGGLDILRDADLRARLPDITQSTLVIAGARDKLTPPQASGYLAQTMPNARVVEIEGAAHAPFLSHPEIFIERVKTFLHE